MAGADLLKAKSFLYKNDDSAFYYFNKVITGSKDSLQVALSYNNIAVIQSGAGDYFGSQESLLASLRFLHPNRENDINCLASNYNELGLNSLNLKNYDAAPAFFDSAYTVSREKDFRLVILNNKALAYQKKRAYAEAIRIYKAIGPQISKDKAGYARMLTNLATTRWLKDPGYNAAPELIKALHIRKAGNDLWGQNSSYAHLADYYMQRQPDSAFLYGSQMYAVARRLNSPDDQLEALQKLISAGPAHTAKQYFTVYQRLADSVQTARSAARNQFAMIRYDAQKSKADNLKLQRDNTEKRYQIARQWIFLFITLVILIGGSFFAFFWYRKRKQRLELEAEKTIRENQLKLSKKVHDVVANGLYRIMSELENQPNLDKEDLLDSIEDMYEKSRDISYDEPAFDGPDFQVSIAALLSSFATAQVRVVRVGNSEALWEGVSLPVRQELYYILQELMVNMRKHSRAGNVAVLFERQDNHITVNYADDGIGIAAGIRHKNGLTNTGNRIKAINGTINFDVNAGRGLEIRIAFPVA